jgi:hypothetical protein
MRRSADEFGSYLELRQARSLQARRGQGPVVSPTSAGAKGGRSARKSGVDRGLPEVKPARPIQAEPSQGPGGESDTSGSQIGMVTP